MKKLLVIVFCFCFCCPWGGKAQDELYRMELGGGLGGAFYIGDANSKPFANLGPMGSIVARYIFNPRMAIKGNLAVGHISGDTGADFFPQDAESGDAAGGARGTATFKRNVIDIGAQFEFNFWGYGIGHGYEEGYSRITPYMLAGAGLTLAPGRVRTMSNAPFSANGGKRGVRFGPRGILHLVVRKERVVLPQHGGPVQDGGDAGADTGYLP